MKEDTTILPFRQSETIIDPLTELARQGARRMLAEALKAEADAFVASFADEQLEDGRQRIVRHGFGPERMIQTGIGALDVQRPSVRPPKIRGRRTKRQRQPLPTTKTKERLNPKHQTTRQPQRPQNRPRWSSLADKVVDVLHKNALGGVALFTGTVQIVLHPLVDEASEPVQLGPLDLRRSLIPTRDRKHHLLLYAGTRNPEMAGGLSFARTAPTREADLQI